MEKKTFAGIVAMRSKTLVKLSCIQKFRTNDTHTRNRQKTNTQTIFDLCGSVTHLQKVSHNKYSYTHTHSSPSVLKCRCVFNKQRVILIRSTLLWLTEMKSSQTFGLHAIFLTTDRLEIGGFIFIILLIYWKLHSFIVSSVEILPN